MTYLRDRDDWWERRGCRDVDPRIFDPKPFPGGRPKKDEEGNTIPFVRDWSEAAAVCAPCPVKTQCLSEAMRMATDSCYGPFDGYQAGLTPDELTTIYRRRQSA